MDNKVQETIGDVYCPTSINEECVYISTNSTSSFYDCQKFIACCHVLKIPFQVQKPTFLLFGGDSTHCFAKSTSRNYQKKQPSPVCRSFSANNNQAHSNLSRKREKSLYIWHNCVGIPSIDTVNQKIIYIVLYTLPVSSKVTWISSDSNDGLSGVSTLDQVQ